MRRAIFDHILKTGGTSVIDAMSAAFDQDEEMPTTGTPHQAVIASHRTQQFLSWHLWFFPYEALASGWHYATVLRDPVDRFLSQYYFHRSHDEMVRQGIITDPEVVAATQHSLENYLNEDSTVLQHSYSNMQARHFAWRCSSEPNNLNDRQLLEAAIASLEDYDLVGVFSDLQGFVDAYCHDCSLPRQIIPRLNTTTSRKRVTELPASVVMKLRSANRVDMALYSWAQHRFARKKMRSKSMSASEVETSLPLSEIGPRPPAPTSSGNFGNGQIKISSIECHLEKKEVSDIDQREQIKFNLCCNALQAEDELTVGIAIRDAANNTVFGTNSRLLGIPLAVTQSQQFNLHLNLSSNLAPGHYRVTLALHKGETHLDGCYHWLDDAASFSVAHGVQASDQTNSELNIEMSSGALASAPPVIHTG